jgi:hypothetical protein
MSRSASDDDVARHYYERVQRSREMPAPEGGYDVHEAAWQWAERMRSLKTAPWHPYARAWEVGK